MPTPAGQSPVVTTTGPSDVTVIIRADRTINVAVRAATAAHPTAARRPSIISKTAPAAHGMTSDIARAVIGPQPPRLPARAPPLRRREPAVRSPPPRPRRVRVIGTLGPPATRA